MKVTMQCGSLALSVIIRILVVSAVLIAGIASAQQAIPPVASIKLHLKTGAFDPTRRTFAEAIQAPNNLSSVVIPNNPYYILQFSGPVRMEWKSQLITAGVSFHDYVPDYAFLVKMDANALTVAMKDEHVRWIGPYEAVCKVAPTAFASGSDVQTNVNLKRAVQSRGSATELFIPMPDKPSRELEKDLIAMHDRLKHLSP